MASVHTLSALGSGGSRVSKHKTSKPNMKSVTPVAVVKPILKKWSQSEKNSLDLDRGWDDQDEQYRSHGWHPGGISTPSFFEGWAAAGQERVVNDPGVTFDEAVAATSNSRKFKHSRSISATSHASVATSNSSGSAAIAPRGAFVHPFQQLPRTTTPPLAYATSMASVADIRDYTSPTINEDDHCENPDPAQNNNSIDSHQKQQQQLARSSYSHTHAQSQAHPHSHSQTSLAIRRPSLASQRKSSASDITNPHISLRINTSRSTSTTPAQSSRLVNVSSHSDLYLDRTAESSTSSNLLMSGVGSPSSSTAPMSPLRSSFDASSFPRLRAKSDLDTATRAEHLREARRKFEMRERAKEEKHALQEIKRRERADNKRANELERQAAAVHKEQKAAKARQEAAELEEAMLRARQGRKASVVSSGRPSMSLSRPSLSLRPNTSRKDVSSEAVMAEPEKLATNSYDKLNPRSPPVYGKGAGSAKGVQFQSSKRKNSAKKKTQSTWTVFILWLRTKLLRAGKDL